MANITAILVRHRHVGLCVSLYAVIEAPRVCEPAQVDFDRHFLRVRKNGIISFEKNLRDAVFSESNDPQLNVLPTWLYGGARLGFLGSLFFSRIRLRLRLRLKFT